MNTQTFNTDHLQTYPDSVLQAPKDILIKKNNNTRYKFFKQNHFTAGDEDQFLEYWDRSTPVDGPLKRNQTNLNPEIPLHPNTKWPKYRNLCVDVVISTFHYISDKFKKGLFLKITDGKPKVFLPFSKVDYQNEWSDKIKTNPRRFSNIVQLMKYTADVEKREFLEGKVHKNIKAWYGNNGLVRLEFPISEGDSGVNMLHDMFTTLVRERKLPSCELFINKRDFPLLKKDDTESYDSFFGTRTKLLSHSYEKYAPILSMTTTDAHADIPIPTWEDWSRVTFWNDGKMFGKDYRSFPRPEEFDAIEWSIKIPTAIFRGASTGQGTMIDNNIRLAVAAESAKGLLDEDSIPFMDAGITKWNLRPRKHPSYPYIETIHVDEMPFSLISPMSPLEQAQYKYILHLPGHSEAYRLGMELFSGSVVLYFPCQYQLWFFKWMKPWEHYVPLSGSMQDIYEKIKWCKANDEKCEAIAANARAFAHKYLTRTAILDYLQNTFWDVYTTTGKIEHVEKNINDLNLELYQTVKYQMVTSMNAFYKDNSDMLEHLKQLLSVPHHSLSKDIRLWLFTLFYKNMTISKSIYKEGKNTTLFTFNYSGYKYAIKNTRKTWKSEEKFQLACSYLYMNELSKTCPNFIYTYADFEDSDNHTNIVTEFVEGMTLEEYINTSAFTMASFIDILIGICLALAKAQQKCGFIHMDLFPWNVIIVRKKAPETIVYNNEQGSYTIKTNIVPIIIDYGKSHFIHKGQHYYNTSPFHLCRLQDIISIVFSSIYIILEKHKLNDKDIKLVTSIMNFFSGSGYTNKTNFINISHVKSFLKKHKKFSKMLSEPKVGLEEMSPLDFLKFILDNLPKNSTVTIQHSMQRMCREFVTIDHPFSSLKLKSLELELLSIGKILTKPVDFRKHWLLLEGLWGSIPTNPEHAYLYVYNTRLIFERFIDLIRVFESTEVRVWEQLDVDSLCKDFPTLPQISSFDESCLQSTVVAKLPHYPTHICKSCISKQKFQPLQNVGKLFERLQTLQIISELECKYLMDFFPAYINLGHCYTHSLFL